MARIYASPDTYLAAQYAKRGRDYHAKLRRQRKRANRAYRGRERRSDLIGFTPQARQKVRRDLTAAQRTVLGRIIARDPLFALSSASRDIGDLTAREERLARIGPTLTLPSGKRIKRGEITEQSDGLDTLTALEAATGTLRPVLAVLAGCGLRVGEAVARDWADVSIPTATIDIGRAKTDAGVRQVDIPIGPLQELTEWRARRPTYQGEGDPVFVTEPSNAPVSRQTRRNVAAQLKRAIKRANDRLAGLGIEPISERVTPHSLRRTFASLRAACGDDPVYIAEQGGWTDPTFALRVYAKAVKRRSKLSGKHLREFDRALEWAANGQQADFEVPERVTVTHESPAIQA